MVATRLKVAISQIMFIIAKLSKILNIKAFDALIDI